MRLTEEEQNQINGLVAQPEQEGGMETRVTAIGASDGHTRRGIPVSMPRSELYLLNRCS
jgi:hypothetical protein